MTVVQDTTFASDQGGRDPKIVIDPDGGKAILVGYEPVLEGPLIDYAVSRGYNWVELTPESGVWLSPELALP